MPEKVEDAIQKVIKEALPASCTIYVKSRGKSWSGSGFHIGNGLIITASHVCPPEKDLQVDLTFDSKNIFQAMVIKSDPTIDSALLKIVNANLDIPFVSLANSDYAEIGDTVAVIGAPEGWHDTVTVGRVSNIHQYMGKLAPTEAWNDVIFVDAKILQGVSGGMCIGTDGLVIGSVIGVTGTLAEYGIGENVLCPSNKIISLIR